MSPFERVSKSLKKFIKPIRVALPHYPSKSAPKPGTEDPKHTFKLLRFKRPNLEKDPKKLPIDKQTIAVSDESATQVATPPEPTLSEKAQWIELVIHLLGLCRKLSQRMKMGIGINSYNKALMSRGQSKLRALGSILDTTTIMADEAEDEELKRNAK